MTPAERRKKAHSDLDHAIAAMEDVFVSMTGFYLVAHKLKDAKVDAALWAARAAFLNLQAEGALLPSNRALHHDRIRRLAPVILDMILDAEEEAEG